jgi:hypothetical protein
METAKIILDKERAGELLRAYQTHVNYSEPIDAEIMRAYKEISRGRMIIQALKSIAAAGCGADGWPKLALARADEKKTFCVIYGDGSALMASAFASRGRNRRFEWPARTFPPFKNRPWRVEAVAPLIPLPLRPKRGLENYHVLFEAEWTGAVPHDPFLLRRLGKADLWLVLAQWDLSEIERAALASRVGAA